MPEYRPFVKWAGGKASLLADYAPLLPEQARTYYEPFLGGGAMFFYLRGRGFAENYVLADANEELVLAYRAVRDDLPRLMEELARHKRRHTKRGKPYYMSVRRWDRSPRFHTRLPVKRAARFIYLNKTCFNGLWRVNSSGQFNVPMGRYKRPNILDEERLHAAHEALQGVRIRLGDFADAVSEAGTGDFVYCDPPYVPLNATSSFTSYYADGFGLGEQQRLAALVHELARRGAKVMVSNSNTDVVHMLYAGLHIHPVTTQRRINSDAHGRGDLTELVITSY
jgi:DNA adenine methylase